MIGDDALRRRVRELGDRDWNVPSLEARLRRLAEEGIPGKVLNRDEMLARRDHVLDRVQRRAEEYNFLLKNCAQGTALSLLEEFGLGDMGVIKALTPFPGIGGTGEMCGGVTGGLVTFGLFFGGDLLNFEAAGETIMRAQKFMALFEDEVGFLHCAEIQERIFGRNMDPGAGPEQRKACAEAKGFEKCGLAPGIGARLAAGFILDSMAE